MKRVFFIILITLLPLPAAALAPGTKNIRTANYFLKAGRDLTAAVSELAKFDLVILPAEAQIFNQNDFTELRRRNPAIAILAYVPTKSISRLWSDDLHKRLASGVQPSWRLRDASGNGLSVWPGTDAYNITGPWQSYLAQFVHREIMGTGLWDGIFYDEVSASIAWLNHGNVDTNDDRVQDPKSEADTRWKAGTLDLLRMSRALEGERTILVINGDSETVFTPYANGRMFETFPTPWESGGTWSGVMKNYLRLSGQYRLPRAQILNGNTKNLGQIDQKQIRYGSASTLLGDGFWSYDFGDQDHGQVWSSDESRAVLGAPAGKPKNVLARANPAIIESVWRRDYDHGLVLINSTNEARTVELGGDYEKLRGAHDPVTNNGAIVSEVEVGPVDGLILLRALGTVPAARFRNQSFVRVFNASGVSIRQGFFVSDASAGPGALILEAYLGADGRKEKLIAEEGVLRLLDGSGRLLWRINPYRGRAFEFTLGDLDQDGKLEIVTAPSRGEPRVRIFDTFGRPERSFLAFGRTFSGGVSIAIADGRIVAGAGAGGGPSVRVFDKKGTLLKSFFAYDARFRGGVRVAAGDLDGDGREEIITGAGPGSGPLVRVFDLNGQAKLTTGFFAFASSEQSGVGVAISDVDGNGVNEIVVSK